MKLVTAFALGLRKRFTFVAVIKSFMSEKIVRYLLENFFLNGKLPPVLFCIASDKPHVFGWVSANGVLLISTCKFGFLLNKTINKQNESRKIEKTSS